MLLYNYKITFNLRGLDGHIWQKIIYARSDSIQALKRQKLVRHIFDTTKNSCIGYEIERLDA